MTKTTLTQGRRIAQTILMFLLMQVIMLNASAQIAPTGLTISPDIAPDAVEFPANTTWYKMTNNTQNYVMFYEEGQTKIMLTSTVFDGENAQLWCVTGNQTDGYRFYNKAAGPQKVLSSPTNVTNQTGTNPILKSITEATAAGENITWDFYTSTNITGGFYISQHGQSGKKLNRRGDAGGALAYWTGGADAGSTFVFTAYNPDFAAIKTQAQAIISSNTAGYVGSYSAEQINALNAALTALNADSTNTSLQSALIEAYGSLSKIKLQQGQTYLVKNVGYGRYMSSNSAGTHIVAVSTQNSNDLRQMWTFDQQSNDKYKMYNVGEGRFARSISAASEHFQLVVNPIYKSDNDMSLQSAERFASWTIRNKNGHGAMHEDAAHNVVSWEAGTNTSWYLIPITPDYSADLKAAKDSVIKAAAYSYFAGKVGGHTTEAIAPLNTAFNNMKTNFTANKEAFITALTAARTAARVQPDPTKTYHFKNVTQRYVMDYSNQTKIGTSSALSTSGDNWLLQTYAFVPAGEGIYKIINVKKGMYAKGFINYDTALETTTNITQAATFIVEPSLDLPGIVGIRENASDNGHKYWHKGGSNDIVRWSSPANSPNSGWYIEEEGAIDHVLIDEHQYVTYASPNKKTAPAGVTLHKASLDNATKQVELTPLTITTLAANTGVVVKRETAGSTFFVNAAGSATADAIADNQLVAVTTRTQMTAPVYVLSVASGNIQFNLTTADLHIPARRAYLPNTTVSPAATLSVVFTDGLTTGIEAAPQTQTATGNVYYDLQGRRVAQPTKGIYIVNGKKTYIK